MDKQGITVKDIQEYLNLASVQSVYNWCKNEYELVSKSIMEMQMALDKYNQTVQFEVDI